jgi:ATP-dependent helicase/nuclease subunit A
MTESMRHPVPPDDKSRKRALDPLRSILVEAPAGSGKTHLLTCRFLRLLAQVDEPGEIVAITFTRAAAAEMRHRILAELEKAQAGRPIPLEADTDSIEFLAKRAMEHAEAQDWRLIDLPSQLRISTIDSFCHDLALQQPFLSGIGGEIKIHDHPAELYRRAARRTLDQLDGTDDRLRSSLRALLLWRDNNWQEMEELLIEMLTRRDSWMNIHVMNRELPADDLRADLERPFVKCVRAQLEKLDEWIKQAPGAAKQIMALARFGCEQSGSVLYRRLIELDKFPSRPFANADAIEESLAAWKAVRALLLTNEGDFRKSPNKTQGFPADAKQEKARFKELIAALQNLDGFAACLAGVTELPTVKYSEDEWEIVRACFAVLARAVGELQVVFAEAGAMDFIEVAQIAQRVLEDENGDPTEAASMLADGIRHLLVDEFQDTSRKQHRLLATLTNAWSDAEGRTVFVVGDPKQSIYSFRDADAELFPRVAKRGLESDSGTVLPLDLVSLQSNFRTDPDLIEHLNRIFEAVFAQPDGSDVKFAAALPAREPGEALKPRFQLHLSFMPRSVRSGVIGIGSNRSAESAERRKTAMKSQMQELADHVRSFDERIALARSAGKPFRIAILGRTRAVLSSLAEALRAAEIPFRALELEGLRSRPEILDALALGKALLNPEDRIAWLGVLRAPWCGLSLSDVHILAGTDGGGAIRPIPDLLRERITRLTLEGQISGRRLLETLEELPLLRAAMPNATLGTRLQQVWRRLGGDLCAGRRERANLDLLWDCLDRLPAGAQDLAGPGLDAALDNLKALPDPDASSTHGVQLMTIHKSKGLEFEVVIVPEMQVRANGSRHQLLSWMERGLFECEDAQRITEFLVAPLQTKGEDRGQAKSWLDRELSRREAQEMRRILYVAATRAREELHLAARLEYKEENGDLLLVAPKGTLLATAWPALEAQVQDAFESWKRASFQNDVAGTLDTVAASQEDNVLVMPSNAVAPTIRRLSMDVAEDLVRGRQTARPRAASVSKSTELYRRHVGGPYSRSLGTAVHLLLDELTRLRASMDWPAARAEVTRMEGRILMQARASGFTALQATSMGKEALELALACSNDPQGQWILDQHEGALSESSWAGLMHGAVRSIRVDRIFLAGKEPLAEGNSTLWIIDYKTAEGGGPSPGPSLASLRALFAPQVEAYADMLGSLYGEASIHVGLYYPRMQLLDWWKVRM